MVDARGDVYASAASIGADVVIEFSNGTTKTVSISTNRVGANSAPATKHRVDASVSIEADDTNGIGEHHTFTITVTPDYQTGVTLDSVSITPTGDTGFITAEDCGEAGTGTALTCDVAVNSAVADSATIGANVVLTFSDDSSPDTETVSRSTDATGNNSGLATKIWIDGSLSWIKHDNQGQLLGGETFEVGTMAGTALARSSMWSCSLFVGTGSSIKRTIRGCAYSCSAADSKVCRITRESSR